MINNQAHIYHAKDNVCDAITLTTTHNYNTKNSPTSNNTDPSSGCLHTTMRLHNTNNYQPSSTITVEQRRAGKQPCIRWNEPLYTTAPPHTNQAGTQPRLGGILPTSTTAHTDGPSQTINEDPFMTQRGKVPTYSTNNPFMFFTQHTVNVILQHPTIDDQPYYQAALVAHKAIVRYDLSLSPICPRPISGNLDLT